MSENLKERLRQAALTLSILPVSGFDRPLKMRSAWPDFIQKSRPYLVKRARYMKICPTPEDIDDAMVIIDILNQLPADRRRLVWARACNVPWAALQQRYHASRTHLNLRYKKALDEFIKIESGN